jgi:hypothetical protein
MAKAYSADKRERVIGRVESGPIFLDTRHRMISRGLALRRPLEAAIAGDMPGTEKSIRLRACCAGGATCTHEIASWSISKPWIRYRPGSNFVGERKPSLG